MSDPTITPELADLLMRFWQVYDNARCVTAVHDWRCPRSETTKGNCTCGLDDLSRLENEIDAMLKRDQK